MTFYTTSLNDSLCRTTDRGDTWDQDFKSGFNTAVKRAKALNKTVTLYEVKDYDGDNAFQTAWSITPATSPLRTVS